MCDDAQHSDPGGLISVGTAEARALSTHKAVLVDNPKTPRSICSKPWGSQDLTGKESILQESPTRKLPEIPLPDVSTMRPPPGFSTRTPLSPASPDTMNDLRRRPESSAKRLSIIDPSTVRLSFTGSISDISTPITVPLEEGLQKLYQVYENNVENPIPLPKSVQITNVPLSTIADSLAHRFQEQHAALLDCASQLQYINQQLQLSKQDLNNMECLYSVAVQEANRRALSSDELHLRLEWQKEEITRIDAEKEDALKKVEQQKGENTRLQGEVDTLNDFVEENEMLRQKNGELERRQRYLEGKVEEMRARVERSVHVLRSVPSPVQKMCARLLVPREGQYGEYKRRKDKGRDRKRSGYLIDDAPLPPLQFY